MRCCYRYPRRRRCCWSASLLLLLSSSSSSSSITLRLFSYVCHGAGKICPLRLSPPPSSSSSSVSFSPFRCCKLVPTQPMSVSHLPPPPPPLPPPSPLSALPDDSRRRFWTLSPERRVRGGGKTRTASETQNHPLPSFPPRHTSASAVPYVTHTRPAPQVEPKHRASSSPSPFPQTRSTIVEGIRSRGWIPPSFDAFVGSGFFPQRKCTVPLVRGLHSCLGFEGGRERGKEWQAVASFPTRIVMFGKKKKALDLSSFPRLLRAIDDTLLYTIDLA